MRRIYKWVKKELFHVLPIFVFFFLAFNFVNLTEALMRKKEGVRAFSFLLVFIAASVVAKIFVVIDHLPLVNAFRQPLIQHVVWKTFLYGTASFLVRYLNRLIPFLISKEPLTISYQQFTAAVNWPLFWAIQIWYFVLFFLFILGRELTLVIGVPKIRQIFFGKTKS